MIREFWLKNMNQIEKFKTIVSQKTSKILYQEPGKSQLLREVISFLDVSLIPLIPNTSANNDSRRKGHIVKKALYIVDSVPLHTIWIRSALSDVVRSFSQEISHVKFCDPLHFNYWKLPFHFFDIIIAENPVKLEYLKSDGLVLNEKWFKDNDEELKPLKFNPYPPNYATADYSGRRYEKSKLKHKNKKK